MQMLTNVAFNRGAFFRIELVHAVGEHKRPGRVLLDNICCLYAFVTG